MTTTPQAKNTVDTGGKTWATPKSDSAVGAPDAKQEVKTNDQAPTEPGDAQLAGPRGSTAAAYSTATKAEPDPGMPNQQTGTAGFPYETFHTPGGVPADVGEGQTQPGIAQTGAAQTSSQTPVAADQDNLRQRLRDGKLNAQDVTYLEKLLDQRGVKARS